MDQLLWDKMFAAHGEQMNALNELENKLTVILSKMKILNETLSKYSSHEESEKWQEVSPEGSV